jgi:signal transduction histidine kinase
VQRTAALVKSRAWQQKVTLLVLYPETAVQAEVDVNQFCTVLVNLLLNALDAMPAGGQLTLALEQDGANLQFRVEDTGPGLSSGVAERLFTPFSSTKETGSGLGLSICRRIIEEHGGHITGCNREGGGACFTCRVPARPVSVSAQDLREANHATNSGH